VAVVTTVEQSLREDRTTRATADARLFVPGGLRHGVVAVRAAAGVIDGNAARLSAAGSGPKDTLFDFDADSIGLLRGFSTSSVVGTRAAVLNLDYRFPIAYVERGYRLMPIFLRSLHGAVFADAGTAWTPGHRQDVRTSIGAELSLDGVLGYYWPVSITTGAAWRRDPSPVGAGGGAWFLRFGRAF
jgi:outer membrane protein assembly factor BamA